MKLVVPVFTVVAILLVVGTPTVHAWDQPSRRETTSLVNGPGAATYTDYIGDQSRDSSPTNLYNSSYVGYVDGGDPARERAFWHPSLQKGCNVGKVHCAQKSCAKGPYGKGARPQRSWLYDPWVGIEYMSTWLGERRLPPLVTQSPPGTDGVVPGAKVLFGGDVGGDYQAGGRLTVGAWTDCNRRLGVVGRFFALEGESVGLIESSGGIPTLARPFFETWPGSVSGVGPASFVMAGIRDINGQIFTVQGTVDAESETEILGAETYARLMLHCSRGRRLDLIAGYLFSRVDDNLRVSHVSNIEPGIFGSRIAAEDIFDATNKFHGGQIGLLAEIDQGPCTLSLMAKAGLGNMNEVVTISGRSEITDLLGGVAKHDTGILALPSNTGVYKTDKFTVIPEAEAKLVWRLTRCLDVTVGYSCMYWSDVAMAADQIQTSASGLPIVNSSQWFGGTLQGPPNPTITGITDTDLWLHAVNVGMTFRM